MEALRDERRSGRRVRGKAHLRAEAGGVLAHLDGGFGHAIEGIAAGFCWGACLHKVAEDRGRGAHGILDVFESLQKKCQ